MKTLYCARWVLPIIAPHIEDGAVAVEGTRIDGVGARADLKARFPEAQVREYGEAAIMPGLINCHTHLELTAMRGYLEPEESDFFAWLKRLTLARMLRMTPDDLYASAAWGAVEALRAGVTCVADACSEAALCMEALRDVGLRGTVYQEVFGPDASAAREHFDGLREKIGQLRESESELVRVGISPHAPYTVSAPLLELTSDYALAENLAIMMHAAESQAEKLFMLEGRGAFAEGLMARGLGWRAPGVSSVQYLASIGVLRARPLLAHCINVDAADIDAIREAGAGVAHCPKSNAKFGHGRAPLAAFVQHDLELGLGSDSVASNNTCDLLEEARFALLLSRASGDKLSSGEMIDAEQVLAAATRGGARALNLEQQTGALVEGLQADLIVVGLGGAHQLPVYHPARALIFASSGRDVILTVVAGREVFREGRVTTIDEERLRARVNECIKRIEGGS